MTGDEAKLAASKADSFAQYSLFAKSLTLDAGQRSESVREPESTYAVTKIRTLSEGVSDGRLPSQVRKVIANIQNIDSDGFLFVGDPASLCGKLVADEKRPLCLIWIPGRGKQLLESVQNWLHVASSRLGQKLDQETNWFDAIRTAAVQAVGENVLLATATGTTADPFVCRVGKLFRIPVVRFSVLPNVLDRKWITRQVDDAADADTLRANKPYPAFFSWLPAMENSKADETSECRRKVRRSDGDQLLAAFATTEVLISVRRGGNVFKSVSARLEHRPGLATRILLDRELTDPKVSQSLLKAGAVGWRLLPLTNKNDKSEVEKPKHVVSSHADSISTKVRLLDYSLVCDREFLVHWTRRRVGPWPDTTLDEYLDDLIFQSSRRRQSELAALCRILASRKLISSTDLTRDRRPVTCFSAMRLSELITKRVFRAHLSRWDFEPYGIAFSPAVLKQQNGARPVIYGGESRWRNLNDADRPFFQLQESRSGKIDWRQEKEWRTLGDVDFNRIGADDAIVFVGREADAAAVSEISIWPVVVLPKSIDEAATEADAEVGEADRP